MLTFLPAPLTGAITATLFISNTLLWAIPLYILVIVKVLTPTQAGRRQVTRGLDWVAESWAWCDVKLVAVLLDIEWDVRIDAKLRRRGSYMVLSNHQTWNDIFVAMQTLLRRIPFFKFFLKQQLIWIPILGNAWWALDFPFMKRYSREELEKNPELRGKDLETTRIACQRYAGRPVTIFNYLEGTRFTPEKHARQQSPYRHLLKPKAGGFAYVMNAMGRQLENILDVTIYYPEGPKGFWDFLCGRVHCVVVRIRELPIPDEMLTGDYQEDPEFRKRFQDWVGQIWREKDELLDELAEAEKKRAEKRAA